MKNPECFLHTILRYDKPDHLMPYVARKLLQAIRVGRAEKICDNRHQKSGIEYDLVRFVLSSELLKAVQVA